MELFITLVNDFYSLFVVAKRSIIDVAGVLDSTLVVFSCILYNSSESLCESGRNPFWNVTYPLNFLHIFSNVIWQPMLLFPMLLRNKIDEWVSCIIDDLINLHHFRNRNVSSQPLLILNQWLLIWLYRNLTSSFIGVNQQLLKNCIDCFQSLLWTLQWNSETQTASNTFNTLRVHRLNTNLNKAEYPELTKLN